jgi:hypothetical protein
MLKNNKDIRKITIYLLCLAGCLNWIISSAISSSRINYHGQYQGEEEITDEIERSIAFC